MHWFVAGIQQLEPASNAVIMSTPGTGKHPVLAVYMDIFIMFIIWLEYSSGKDHDR